MKYTPHYDIIGNTRLITYRPEELEELAEKLVVMEYVQQAIMSCYDTKPYYLQSQSLSSYYYSPSAHFGTYRLSTAGQKRITNYFYLLVGLDVLFAGTKTNID
ncbi:MAG: hypothetical protein ACP6IU_12680 [Candidatus Asgardarchaeia archaeon]